MKIRIRVKANKAQNKLVVSDDGTLECAIKAPAVEGKANKELRNYLSKVLKIAKTQVVILKGENSPYKQIEIPLSEEQLKAKLLLL